MNFLINVCENYDFLVIVKFIWKLVKLIFFIAPIIAIVMITLDFSKSVIASKEDDMKKNINIIIKRLIYCVAIFLTPTIVSFSMNLLGNLGIKYANCLNNALDEEKLNNLKVQTETQNKKEEQNKVSNSNNNTTDNDIIVDNINPPNSNENDTSNYKTNVSFTNIDSCENKDIIKTITSSKGKKTKIYFCIREYIMHKKGKTMQNFSITDNYVYFSYNGSGSWANDSYLQKNGQTNTLKKVSLTTIIRINRKNNTYQVGNIEFAGHAQSFDVTNENTNQIYTNYFAKLYKGSLGNGSKYVGFTILPFESNTKKSGIEMLPQKSFYLNKTGKKISILNTSNYIKNNKLSSSYYEKVRSIGKDSNNMTNPEIAVDESNNRIAFVSGTTAYIYELNKIKQGQANLLKKFSVSSDKQGVELYNGNLYIWKGTRKKDYTLKKYNINTGKEIDSVTIDLKKYYSTNENNNGHEAEGISINKGNIYLGIQGNNRNNDILLIKGF